MPNGTQTRVSVAQHACGLGLVERDRALELSGADRGVDLSRVHARVAEECADLLQVVLLLEDFHRHAVPQIVGLELGHADAFSVRLAEAPDVLAVDRHHALYAPPARPARPESGVSGPTSPSSRTSTRST